MVMVDFSNKTLQPLNSTRSNLKNLLLTKKGERVLQPNFGSGLQDLLFEPIDDEFEGKQLIQ